MRRQTFRPLLPFVLAIALAVPVFTIGGQFGLEFAIDAPWRLEPVPNPDGSYGYGPIPIVVTFHDTVFEDARPRVSSFTRLNPINVGRLHEIQVIEWTADQPHPRHPVTVIPARELREIQRKKLVSTKTKEPDHDICRPTASQSCDEFLEIARTHEWHGAFWYTPRAAVTPGRNIHLEVIVVTDVGGFLKTQWRNYLVVHAGEKPLPRFADDWLYGDFHYHSQMTDNEGESGYSYRNVARALGAAGMDFVFATDHASNGVQIDGAIDSAYCADRRGSQCMEARDFNEPRFRAAKSLLYGPDGVNAMIEREADTRGLARLRAANILPQVYLGEEVDVIPEITREEHTQGIVHFGDGLRYPWPDASGCLAREGLDACRKKYSHVRAGFHLVLDEQGIPVEESIDDNVGNETVAGGIKLFTPDLTGVQPSRQHLVYFPTSVSQNADGWIASDTGQFGGGGKRLVDMLREIAGKGVAFLAHPLSDSRPGGAAGPDIVPYSDLELTQAWQSPAILGLQFWNENDRHRSSPNRLTPTVMFVGRIEGERTMRYSFPWPFQGHQTGNFPWFWQRHAGDQMGTQLYHSAFTWDRYLRKGLDPQQTATLAWLTPGEPRKWFMAGGSDSHGDFNFRRHGRPGIDRWTDVPVGDTAIGNPRNLVSMSQPPGRPVATDERTPSAGPRRYSNQAVIGSLQAGRFAVTDGPAIRIAIDRNLNGVIDEPDVPMGGTFDFYAGDRIPLLVEWLSTPEFGPIARVDVYVGHQLATFAPSGHGPDIPRGPGRDPSFGRYQPDPSKTLQVQLADAFGRFIGGGLPANAAYHGVARLYLSPAQFQLVRADKSLSYVRAYARTIAPQQAADLGICGPAWSAGNKCGNRQAYSNPIWSRYNAACPAGRPDRLGDADGAVGRPAATFVDANRNRFPDACEDVLQDACRVESRRPMDDVRGDRPVVADRPPSGSGSTSRPERQIPATSCQKVAGL